MKEDKPNRPPKETTKDDSSDVEKVRQDKQGPPPEQECETDREQQSSQTAEEREAEKGHS